MARIDDIESRLNEIDDLCERAKEDATICLDGLSDEAKTLIEERQTILEEAEKRSAVIENVVNTTKGETIEVPEIKENEVRNMTELEVRSSLEYGKAFINGLKNDSTYAECRSLLSGNASSGLIASGNAVPVPTMLEEEIKTAWEECKLLSLVKKSNFKGNVKVGFEVSATGASVHDEGTDAPEEENIVIGSVTIQAKNIKKWITVSDEALEGTTVDTIGYLYKEIAQKIAEEAENVLIGKINDSPEAATKTKCGVKKVAANPDVDTILNAVCALSGQAKNITIAMNRATYAAFRKVELSANYGIDVFEGLRDKVVFTDALPAFGTASADDCYAIVGDFGYGAQANLPNGDGITLKLDDLSLAEADLVKIVGRQYVGMAVVADKAFARICKAAG